ncbi:hypothetical protein DRJ16_07115 [Candidatus Woesearchaeota archaeon]|nr:MAG: hypothetical protein DRJ16_07115 [Candidatus Woesearchaeota archaeon]
MKDNPPNSQLRQELQRAFYTFNQSLRAGAESLFINVSFFDRYFAEALFSNYPLFNLDGFMEFQRFVMEWHMKEVTTRQMLRFPVITAACVKDEDGHIRDREFLELACRMNMKHTMYNFLVLEEPTAIASCCRLLNDKASFFNSYGSGGVQIGSHQVVSINLPHLWLRYGDDCEDALIEYALLIRHFLDWHRKLLIEHQHLDKLYGLGFKSVNRMFSTLGIIGVWDFKKLSGWSWEEVRDMLKKMQDAYVKDSRYNIELVPGESAAIKLYRNDAREFEHPYLKGIHMYSNQVVSPWTEEVPLPRKVKINAMFRDIFTGGQMMFVNIPSAFQTWEQMARIVEGIGSVGVPYFCFDTTLTQCAQNHITLGEKERCPICNEVIKERFRRIVGYFVALDNAGERQHLDFPYRAPDRMGSGPSKFSA